MTLEEFFVKDYQELKERNEKIIQEKLDIEIEFEKKVKLLEIELNEKTKLLNEIGEFFKNGTPKNSKSHLWIDSYYLTGEEQAKAIAMLKILGVEIKEEE